MPGRRLGVLRGGAYNRLWPATIAASAAQRGSTHPARPPRGCGAPGRRRTHRPCLAWTPPERRLAAAAALGLFLTLFLPWYQETVIASGKTPALQSASASLTGWGAFSFVEAAVLLVAVGVLVLLFERAEGRAFHVPGGDGGVITAAGGWTVALIVWRMFDKEGTTGHGQYATTSGIEWGIFVALGVAAALVYAGQRIRAAHEPEPPLPGERPVPDPSAGPAPRRPAAASSTVAPPTAVTDPAEPEPYVRKRPRFDAGATGRRRSRPTPPRRPPRRRPPRPPASRTSPRSGLTDRASRAMRRPAAARTSQTSTRSSSTIRPSRPGGWRARTRQRRRRRARAADGSPATRDRPTTS